MKSIWMSGRVGKIGRPFPPLDGLLCHYCGVEEAVGWDHVVPWSLRSTNELSNLVPACHECNSVKKAVWPDCSCDFCRAAVEAYVARPGMLQYAKEQTERLNKHNGNKLQYRLSLERIEKEMELRGITS